MVVLRWEMGDGGWKIGNGRWETRENHSSGRAREQTQDFPVPVPVPEGTKRGNVSSKYHVPILYFLK